LRRLPHTEVVRLSAVLLISTNRKTRRVYHLNLRRRG
jgi:hypothetical protein